MGNRILVPVYKGYGSALAGLGEITDDVKALFGNPKDFMLVLFTGGSDVDPSFYGHTSPEGICYTNPSRDYMERTIFAKALKHAIPMAGICRGAQFINVMSGGVLMHDITHHDMGEHQVVAPAYSDLSITTNTLHHQMIVPPKDGYTLAWTAENLSTHYIGDEDKKMDYDGPEVEAVWIPATNCLGAQWHPETMHPKADGYKWFKYMVQQQLALGPVEFTAMYAEHSYEKIHGGKHVRRSEVP